MGGKKRKIAKQSVLFTSAMNTQKTEQEGNRKVLWRWRGSTKQTEKETERKSSIYCHVQVNTG